MTPSWEKILVTRLRQQAQLSATEAVLALRAYERERGELPENLGALVPEFMPAVPRDAYDGRPIRYSKDRGVVWSVGENALETPEREAWEARPERERRRETVCWLRPAKAGGG